MKSNYKRLGDYIRQVDVRNHDLAVTDLLGLSIAKQFIPSIANTIGTDLSSYKIVKPRQFGYVPVTSRNGDKITVALYTADKPCIISQAYTVFEVINENSILPEYLMMWFRRPEFDRYSRFKSHGSAREVFEWDEMCEVLLPIPTIEEQRKIVAEYQAIERRIENNCRLIATLEDTAQTIYRQMFVDNIDPNNLPQGWRRGKFTDMFNLGGGGTPSTSIESYWTPKQIPLFSPEDIKNHKFINSTIRQISNDGLNHCNSPVYPKWSTFLTVRGSVGKIGFTLTKMAMNQSCYCVQNKLIETPIFSFLSTMHYVDLFKHQAVGAVFNAMVTKDFDSIEVVIPSIKLCSKFEGTVRPLFYHIENLVNESSSLYNLLNLFLSKLTKF